jgi:hypothetical protein
VVSLGERTRWQRFSLQFRNEGMFAFKYDNFNHVYERSIY